MPADFRKLYAEKLQRDEPWWKTDYANPRTRIRSAWATMPPRTSLEDIQTLLGGLDGLCDSPVSETHASNDSGSENQKDADQDPAAAELAASLAAVEDDPAAHRLLRRQSKDACVVAHAIAEELAVELARERSESFALSVSEWRQRQHTEWGTGADIAILQVYNCLPVQCCSVPHPLLKCTRCIACH
eukprot:COSAG02_NODE_22046_length_765_cov_1.241742_1_plen_187_part_00